MKATITAANVAQCRMSPATWTFVDTGDLFLRLHSDDLCYVIGGIGNDVFWLNASHPTAVAEMSGLRIKDFSAADYVYVPPEFVGWEDVVA